ncbi:hypothetical protein SCFA_380010 [anaerobic digester metagenome]|uniref:Uncharacterized protein n=1 Tax=anaerobic digester metagenome TaxID=1263854 RepID=A0A485M010_9ZZZZ
MLRIPGFSLSDSGFLRLMACILDTLHGPFRGHPPFVMNIRADLLQVSEVVARRNVREAYHVQNSRTHWRAVRRR